MNRMELMMRRRNVAEFIRADPVTIEFQRKASKTKTAAGGWVRGGNLSIPPQRARIVQNRRRYTAGIVNSEAGDIPNTDYLLVGNHTLDIMEQDTFVWKGEHYQVDGIFELREESVLAGITFFGEENHDGTE